MRRVEFRKTSTMGIYSHIPSRIFALIYFNIKIRILHSRKVFSFANEWEILKIINNEIHFLVLSGNLIP